MKKILIGILLLWCSTMQAKVVTKTYTGREVAENWNLAYEWYPGETFDFEHYDWDEDGCSCEDVGSYCWLISKNDYYEVQRLEIGITPNKYVRGDVFQFYAFIGEQSILAEQEAYIFNAREQTDIAFSVDGNLPMGQAAIEIPLTKTPFTINYIRVTYNDVADGNRQLKWSATDVTADLGETFTSPSLSGETKGVVFSSSDKQVAIIDSEANVTLVAAGTCQITATCPQDYPWHSAAVSYNLTVTDKLTGEGTDETVTLTQAGTLKEKITDLESVRIRSIKVVGPINGADLAYLHTTTGRFSTLVGIDLSDATLQPDDVVYATRTVKSDIGMGGVTYQYIMSNEDREECHSTPTGLGGAITTVRVYNTRLAGAFLNMDALKHAILPAQLTELGEYTYAGCKELLKASVPQSSTTIPEGAFSGCEKLRNISWPKGVQEIGDNAFEECGITNAELQNVKQMGKSAFRSSGLFGSIDLSSLRIVPENAFRSSTKLTEVVFSEKLDTIQAQAFESTGLVSATLPKEFKYIGVSAFSCSNLQNVVIPDEGGMIGRNAFYETSWYKHLLENAGSDDIIYIGNNAYCIRGFSSSELAQKTSFSIKEGTRYLNENLFSGLKNITKVSLPSTLLKIGDYAFYNCKGLKEIQLPESLQTIGEKAFFGCNSITAITFDDALHTIGKQAFGECTGLGTVTLGHGIEQIGDNAFCWCDGLVRIKYDVPKAKGRSIFGYCTGLERITFGPNVRNIPDEFAYKCYNLVKFDFEDVPNVRSTKAAGTRATEDKELTIGDYAFSSAPLTSIVLPHYLTSIGRSAFSGNALKTVTCYLHYPIDIEDTRMYDNGQKTTIYLPEDALDIFSQEIHWNQCTLKGLSSMDGIKSIDVDSSDAKYGWYDLSGKRIPHPIKGVNIKVYNNGKTVKQLMP